MLSGSVFASEPRNSEMREHNALRVAVPPGLRLLTEIPALRNGSDREWSGPCPLGTPSKEKQGHLGPMASCPSQYGGSSLPDAVSDVIFLTDHINTASGTLYVAFYLATAFFSTTLSREEVRRFGL